MNTKKKILIAEDSREWQRYHVYLLSKYEGCEFDYTLTSSAQEALSIAQEHLNEPFDLILSDLQMETDFLPKYAGEWFIEQIKLLKQYDNTGIVIISATYNISFIAATLGVDYLSKRNLVNNPDSYYFMLDEKLLR